MNKQFFIVAALAALLTGCSKEMIAPVNNGVGPVFTATIDPVEVVSRTQMDSGEKHILWSAGDKINVFDSDEIGYEFTAGGAGSSVSFTLTDSDSPSETDFWYALYPYDEDADLIDGVFTTTLKSEFTETRTGSFNDNMNIAVAKSSTMSLSFKNVLGWIRLASDGLADDVVKIEFRGNDDEYLAGQIEIDYTGETPVATLVANKTKVMTINVENYVHSVNQPKEERVFFYIPVLPQTFAHGFNLKFYNSHGISGSFNYDKSFTFKRGQRNAMFAGITPPDNEIWYTTSDGEAINYSLDGESGNEFDGGVVAPNDNGGVGIVRFTAPVTKVDDEAFTELANLTSVNLPDCVETIGTSAFEYCQNLTKVRLGSSLKTIGEWAFGTCGFETIDFLPEGLLNIGAGAFSDCYNLVSVTIPTSVTNIQYHSSNNLPMGSPFYGSTSIESFSGKFATSDGKALVAQGTDGRNYLVSIAYAAFDAEDTFVVPEGVTAIAHFACWTASFGQVVLPETLTAIRDAAFLSCFNLSSLTIPASLSTIGCQAFNNCKNLEWVSIETPSVPGVTGTYYNTGGMFNGSSCPINVPDELVDEYKTTAYWSDYEGRYNFVEKESDKFIYYTTTDGEAVDYHVNSATGNQLDGDIVAPKDNGGVGVIKFKHAITTIDNSAFYESENLQSVTLPDCVVKLGDNSFRNCENLMDVNLGTGLTMIGRYAFAECNFVEVDFLPASLKRIGAFAFESCPNLLEVTIPESVEFLGYYSDSFTKPLGNPFIDCTKLQRFNGKFATQDGRGLVMVKDDIRYFISFATYGMDYSSYTVPPVDFISFYAFYGSTLAQVQLPDCLAVISDRAFMDSQILTSITIPSSVVVVGGQSFAGCSSLESITITTPYVPDAFGSPNYVQGRMFDGSYCPIFVPSTLLSSYLGARFWMDYSERLRAYDGASGTLVYTSPYESGEDW